MSRPRPKIINEMPIKGTYKSIVIAEGRGYYVVLYNDRPFTMITVNNDPKLSQMLRLYGKTGFPNPAHAHKLAGRLNEHFMTTKFTVKKIL